MTEVVDRIDTTLETPPFQNCVSPSQQAAPEELCVLSDQSTGTQNSFSEMQDLDTEATVTNIPIHETGETVSGTTWDVYEGDALTVLKTLPSNTFHCVITSPPYFWLRDYHAQNQIGKEEKIHEYVDKIVLVMDEIRRVLRSDGLLFLNLGDTYYSGKGQSRGKDRKSNKRRFGLRAVDKSGGMGLGLQPKTVLGIPWRVALAMMEHGWALRSPIIWNRDKSLPESVKDRPRRSYEYIFLFAKQRSYYFNRAPLTVPEDIWNFNFDPVWTIAAKPKSTNGLQTAPFPDELVQRCLDIGCPPNGKVLDPFAGSGTTLRVGIQSGKSVTGIDISHECCEYMVAKLRELSKLLL
jgi:DNA modification methylase